MDQLVALGNRVTEYTALEVFEVDGPVTTVTLTTDEVTALCPVTGQPDWYTVEVKYFPTARCVESKTFKLYMQSFRNRGIFAETLAGEICETVLGAAMPDWVEVTVRQKPRGGVAITAFASTRE